MLGLKRAFGTVYHPQSQGKVERMNQNIKQVGGQEGLKEGSQLPTAQWVLLRVIKWKWSDSRWTGHFEVMVRTSHVVRLKGKGDTWYHWSQCTEAEEPSKSLPEVRTDLQQLQEMIPGSAESENSHQSPEEEENKHL